MCQYGLHLQYTQWYSGGGDGGTYLYSTPSTIFKKNAWVFDILQLEALDSAQSKYVLLAHSLLDNAPNYLLVGCVIQKSFILLSTSGPL